MVDLTGLVIGHLLGVSIVVAINKTLVLHLLVEAMRMAGTTLRLHVGLLLARPISFETDPVARGDRFGDRDVESPLGPAALGARISSSRRVQGLLDGSATLSAHCTASSFGHDEG